jgi:hypothetical protein
MQITITQCICKRCKYKWLPRITGEPKNCPKCKSPRWNLDYSNRTVNKAREVEND